MQSRASRRSIALIAIAAPRRLGACSSIRLERGRRAAAACGRQRRARRWRRPIAVGYLPKDIVNQYFDAAKTGIDKAATELGATGHQGRPDPSRRPTCRSRSSPT